MRRQAGQTPGHLFHFAGMGNRAGNEVVLNLAVLGVILIEWLMVPSESWNG